jgi:hypothetical protein
VSILTGLLVSTHRRLGLVDSLIKHTLIFACRHSLLKPQLILWVKRIGEVLGKKSKNELEDVLEAFSQKPKET